MYSMPFETFAPTLAIIFFYVFTVQSGECWKYMTYSYEIGRHSIVFLLA